MLRPEQMSKVSVIGAKRVMPEVIETVHELHLVHLSDYDGSWEGFTNGDPIEGSEEAAEKLVTVRALESILDITPEDATGTGVVDDPDARLEEIREEVNALDDRRTELRDELRGVNDQIRTLEPFADLGIDLDLLSGYDSLEVAVGEADVDEIAVALEDAEDVRASETFTGGDVVAIFAATDVEGALDDALVGVAFDRYAIPEASGSPADRIADLEHRKRQLENDVEQIQRDLDRIKLDAASFLLRIEEELTIEVQRAEAPLQFATTDRSFIAEGWVPSASVDSIDGYENGELERELREAVGDHVEIEELVRADYDRHGVAAKTESVHGGDGGDGAVAPEEPATAEATGDEQSEPQEQETMADGGIVTMDDGGPPVRQHNPSMVKPFELLTNAVGRPKYTELDPTIILFLTFPLMFGFMIGDVGYGLIYTAIGYYVYASADSKGFRDFGIVATSAGVMTIVFGILYGEFFGFHFVSEILWDPLIGHAPLNKGLSPGATHWAQAWFVITALFGVVHLNIGYVFEFIENRVMHGFTEAMLETGSWLLAINGFWLFVFSRLFADTKPDLLYTVFNEGEGAAFALGFAGLPAWVGYVGGAMVIAGGIMIVLGPTHEIIEFHVILGHVLSYLRIGAVLLAKAGMAFAVNLLVFGAYLEHGEYHFMHDHTPEYVLEHTPEATIMFDGLVHGGVAAILLGIVVLVVGHLVVLLLGITSAGIQSIRLEYFEFFSKFYDGGGTVYAPFGHERERTVEP